MSIAGFPKGPRIADIWSKLPENLKEEVLLRFMKWLADCLKRINHENYIEFSALLEYHKEDLIAIFSYMLNPEFTPYVDKILKMLGLG